VYPLTIPKGVVAFGESILKATDLHATILHMHQAHMYAKLVFYLEACESGSMFKVRRER
jgi:legumain